MAYSDVADVESEFKDLSFTTSTNVTSDDVDQFIIEADALIDSFLVKRYVTPVTSGTVSLELLKLYSRSIVADRVRGILANKQASNTSANQEVRQGLSRSAVIKELMGLRDGLTSLPDATRNTTSAFYSKNYTNSVAPIVEKDTKQW